MMMIEEQQIGNLLKTKKKVSKYKMTITIERKILMQNIPLDMVEEYEFQIGMDKEYNQLYKEKTIGEEGCDNAI